MRVPIWNRLKDFKCPFCSNDLKEKQIPEPKDEGGAYQCPKCSFYIGKGKFNEIVQDILKPAPHKSRIMQEIENQDALNNL